MYRLDLETLLQVLRDRTGLLRAEITGIPRTKGACQVFVVLQQGQVTACVIHNQQGKKFDGEHARLLLRGKTLEWSYEEQHAFTNLTQASPSYTNNQPAPSDPFARSSDRHPTMPEQYSPQRYTPGYENGPSSGPQPGRISPKDLQLVPRRTGLLPEQILQSWSRQQRSIFSLIDGNHSIAMIAALLHIDEVQTLAIIYEMANQRLVTF